MMPTESRVKYGYENSTGFALSQTDVLHNLVFLYILICGQEHVPVMTDATGRLLIIPFSFPFTFDS